MPRLFANQTPRPDPEASQLADQAASELTRFDAELGHRVANVAPILLYAESASSSQIENLTASARAIFGAELGLKKSRNAELIAANTKAMTAALELAADISADSILQMYGVLMENQRLHIPGRWRNEPVWIGTRGDSPVGADFVARTAAECPR